MVYSLRPLNPEYAPGGSFRIPPDEAAFAVGSGEGSELLIDHDSVSSRHARLTVGEGARLEVVDCGSANGTYVNGVRVERQALAVGDLLGFAMALYQVEAAPEDGDAALEAGALAREAWEEAFAKLSAEADELRVEQGNLREELARRESEHSAVRLRFEGELEETLRREAGALALLNASRQEGAAEAAQLREELANIQADSAHREEEQAAVIRRLERDLEETLRREEGALARLGEARQEVLDRDGQIAALHYETKKVEGALLQSQEEFRQERELAEGRGREGEALRSRIAELVGELDTERVVRGAAEARADEWIRRIRGLSHRLLEDWKAWGDLGVVEEASEEDADAVFCRVENLAVSIRGQLDRIEPIWHEFGGGVQDELARRCEILRGDIAVLQDEKETWEKEVKDLRADSEHLRQLVDAELRRAHGLSRRGVFVEVPKRLEGMVIARDREQEGFRSLIGALDLLDRLLEGLRGSRRHREWESGLLDLRSRLGGILGAGGVQAYGFEPGHLLRPGDAPRVQIMGKKGWGAKGHVAQPFQAGEVVKVLRGGYRLGQGGDTVILRKAEVLIRGAGT